MRLAELKLLHLPRFRSMLVSRAEMRARLSLPVPVRRVFAGGSRYLCPICDSRVGSFRRFGHIRNAWCPVCGGMDRHRLVWLFFRSRTDLFDGVPKTMLHVAPEPAIGQALDQVAGLDHVTADLLEKRVRVQMDITDIQFPADSFDVIYCSHVLEHVPDDRKAMREFYRVLRAGRWATFMVPITVSETVEDPSCADPGEKERRFGQHDHVRRYGHDFEDRLREAGFHVTVIRPQELVNTENSRKHGITASDLIFFCQK